MGKGFAIGSATLTALALYTAYTQAVGLRVIDLTEAYVVAGTFIGGVIPFCIAALTMNSVGRATYQMVNEIRRHFEEIPRLMEGKAKPDSARCMAISATAVLKEMIAPGLTRRVGPAGCWPCTGEGGTRRHAIGSDAFRRFARVGDGECRRRLGQCEKTHQAGSSRGQAIRGA
jgi:Na+/H+-translocating membrane pyrophosphatase